MPLVDWLLWETFFSNVPPDQLNFNLVTIQPPTSSNFPSPFSLPPEIGMLGFGSRKGPDLNQTEPDTRSGSGSGSGSGGSWFSVGVWFGVRLLPDLSRTQSKLNRTPNPSGCELWLVVKAVVLDSWILPYWLHYECTSTIWQPRLLILPLSTRLHSPRSLHCRAVAIAGPSIVSSWSLLSLSSQQSSWCHGYRGHHVVVVAAVAVAIVAVVLQQSLQWYLGSWSLVIVAALCFLRLQVVPTPVLSLAVQVKLFEWWSFSHARPHFTSQLSSIVIFLGLVSWNTAALGVGRELGANGQSLTIGD